MTPTTEPSKLKKAWRAFLAAITSPTAVKQEKSVAVFIVTRVLLAIGASEGLIKLVQAIAA